MSDARLYVVVRADLPPGQQAVQACHAVTEYLYYNESVPPEARTIVLLSVRDEAALLRLVDEIELRLGLARGMAPVAIFREPDLDGQATALATAAPTVRRLMRTLPLALSAEMIATTA